MAFALALATLCAVSCASPAYYWQAVSGQMTLNAKREPIDEVIASTKTEPTLRSRLIESRQILEFASSELALPAEDAYRQWVETGREAIVWNVVATPELSLDPKTWCHIVAGCVAYRGYFDQDNARGFAEKLSSREFDTGIFPAVAYSTLGWFDDPLTDTMLGPGGDENETTLAARLFHELAHQQLYVKGDSAFSEGYARFVERAGVNRWLVSHGDDQALERWRQAMEQSREAEALMAAAREALQSVYTGEAAPEEMRASKNRVFETLVADLNRAAGGATRWIGPTPNNAHLALTGQYEAGQCAFASLLEQAGGNFSKFHQLASEQAELNAENRDEWLKMPCEPDSSRIASHADL